MNESDLNDDPEALIQNLEDEMTLLDLYTKALRGDVDALVKCSFLRDMITEEQYKDFLEIDSVWKTIKTFNFNHDYPLRKLIIVFWINSTHPKMLHQRMRLLVMIASTIQTPLAIQA